MGNVKVELDLSNYARKADFKNVTGVDTSSFAKTSDLVSLKSEIDKLHFNKLDTTPVDFGQLSDVVKNDIVKKIELVKKVNAIQTIDTINLVKRLTLTSKLLKLKRNT